MAVVNCVLIHLIELLWWLADAEHKCRLIVGAVMLLLLECIVAFHLEFTLRITRNNILVSLLESGE